MKLRFVPTHMQAGANARQEITEYIENRQRWHLRLEDVVPVVFTQAFE